MQNFKSVLSSAKTKVAAAYGAVADWFVDHGITWERVINVFTVIAFALGLLALAALIWLQVRPLQLANIKVPVATDQASYYPGEDISGIFFGDTYYKGEVRVLREVFCKDYKGIIKPPVGAADGDFFTTQGRPRHLEGQSIVVGNLPSDIPVGLNCVLQFTNVYEIQTPFGIRKEEYQYYTQNFSIVTKERRQQLECEASGRKDCNYVGEGATTAPAAQETPSEQSSPETEPVQQPQTNVYNDNRSTTNNTTITPEEEPAEPAPRYEERCTVNLLGVKVNCRQVQVN